MCIFPKRKPEFSAMIFDWDTVFGIRFPYACTLRIIAVFLGPPALCLPTIEVNSGETRIPETQCRTRLVGKQRDVTEVRLAQGTAPRAYVCISAKPFVVIQRYLD